MKLLVAVDLSEQTGKVIECAQQLATAVSGQITLLHVAQPDPDFVGYDAGPQSERDARAADLNKERKDLQDLADQLRKNGVDTLPLVVPGTTAETILNEANKQNAEMIVLGSHGRGAISKLLVGSTSEGVLRNAECPVVVIPTR